MKKFFSFLVSRTAIVCLLILAQVFVLLLSIWRLSNYYLYFEIFFMVLSMCMVIWIINRKDNPSLKIAWIIPVLTFPVFGGLLYLFFGRERVTDKMVKMGELLWLQTKQYLPADQSILDEISAKDQDAARQVAYLERTSRFPVSNNTISEYLTPGEKLYDRMKEELRKAEHYIFMEYFIITEGSMWDGLLEILIEKAKAGLDVRVMYDDIGCLQTLPYHYDRRLREAGIKTVVFNPFKPVLNIRMNNRDHRKITVIDGHTAFTGGINLADEYINAYEKYGHWKDASIMLKGDAVWNFTVMFLQLWNYFDSSDQDFEQFRPHQYHPHEFEGSGYHLPFSDQPLDDEPVYENAYIQIIGMAKRYVYINTPYLIVGNEMITALSIAAKSGVDVRIVTPAHADKWFVHMVTRSFYRVLIEAGVKIYEYSPGFMHSKTYVSDDTVGIVGTCNMDFRSLYLHFECGVWMFQTQSLLSVRDDFMETLKVCREISLEETQSVRWPVRILRGILNVFAPLM